MCFEGDNVSLSLAINVPHKIIKQNYSHPERIRENEMIICNNMKEDPIIKMGQIVYIQKLY